MEIRVIITSPEITPNEFRLAVPITIGRSRDANIKLVHGQISRLHCELIELDGQLTVRDLGSLNGTFLNSERVSEAAVPHGSKLVVGLVEMRVEQLDPPPPPEGQTRITDTVRTGDTLAGDLPPPPPEETWPVPPPAEEKFDPSQFFISTDKPKPSGTAARQDLPPTIVVKPAGKPPLSTKPAPSAAATAAGAAAAQTAGAPAEAVVPAFLPDEKAAAANTAQQFGQFSTDAAHGDSPVGQPHGATSPDIRPASPAPDALDVDAWLAEDAPAPQVPEDDLNSFFEKLK
ncbi:MAG: FHA domain-containing protein [Pirellulales bacterium]|nr:FHA domain-containing protein [Pirellulales bacterium]